MTASWDFQNRSFFSNFLSSLSVPHSSMPRKPQAYAYAQVRLSAATSVPPRNNKLQPYSIVQELWRVKATCGQSSLSLIPHSSEQSRPIQDSTRLNQRTNLYLLNDVQKIYKKNFPSKFFQKPAYERRIDFFKVKCILVSSDAIWSFQW